MPALIGAITERTKVIFLCTPNNPTGNRIDDGDLRRILRLGLPTVIDEAYVEFASDGRTMSGLISEFPNAIVLRTFSKAYGLAGLRVGYALAHPAQIRLLSRVKVPWNLPSVAIAAAIAVLDDVTEQSRRMGLLREGGEYLVAELSRLPGLQVTPCEANFVLVDTSGSHLTAEAVVEKLLLRGVFLRSLRSHRGGRSLVRITIGDEAQNRSCVGALRELFAQPARAVVQ